MEKVRWGFIGAGYIAKLALYPALLNSNDGEIYAVASKDSQRAIELEIAGKITEERFVACDPYQLMADAMSRRIRGGSGWLMPHADSLAFAKTFERTFAVMGRP